MPIWVQAGWWGFVAGSALLLGAGAAYVLNLSQRVVALIMAFGAGVLISALSFELMDEAIKRGGFPVTGLSFLAGAAVFTFTNRFLNAAGARRRKHSGDQQPGPEEGGGAAIALGALLDGIPESVVIGVSLLAGGPVSGVAVAAVFLSNFPEGLSSASGMRKAGRSKLYVFGVWGGIALASALAAALGALLLAGAPPEVTAGANALAAGAILAMLADTMVPEAFEVTRDFTGLVTALGFLAAFALSKVLG